MKTLTAWDIETTIKSAFKRKATPFGGLNYCVVHGFKHFGEQTQAHYFGKVPPGPGWIKQVLRYDQGTDTFGTRMLAGFNIKFDLLHALQDAENLHLWMKYVSRGGLIWDTQLAEYLLNGMKQSEHMLSLDEVAPRYGGEVKIDEVKLLWASGVETYDIEPTLLLRYLVGEDLPTGRRPGDVENTELIALAQIDRAKKVGQLNSIILNMGSLLCTIEMERNGMFIDVALGMVLAEELRVQIAEVRAELEKYLPPMPFEFKWTSRFHKSALIFGGTVKWDAYQYDYDTEMVAATGGHDPTWGEVGTIYKHVYDALPSDERPKLLYSQKDELHYLMQDGTTMACDWWEHLNATEWFDDPAGRPEEKDQVVNKGGKNAGEPKTKKVKVDNLEKPKGRACKAPYKFDGFTYPEKRWESSDPGFYSTASEVIEELADRNVPFLKAFADLQSLTKDLSTYYIVTDPETGESKGMLSLVDPDGFIHHKLNHTSTVTARFSSSDPNLQNISKGLIDPKTGKLVKGSQVKRVFVSRFKDGVIIQSDFTALEVYVQAILTRCKQLIADLKAGLDMHCARVATKEKIEYTEAVKLCKGYTDEVSGKFVEADPVWDKKRTEAKVFSFQRAYGAGAEKISVSIGIPKVEVEALILAENTRYPEIEEYYADLTLSVKRSRRPGGGAVPHPDVRGVMCNLGTGTFRTPDGKLYSYQEHPAPEYLVKRGIFSSFSPTELKNYVAQGGGGEWAKAAMWLAVREFYARENFGNLALLVNQVHDALYADADPTVKMEAAAVLHACMEGASDFMEWFFNWNVPVPVPSDTTWGPSMMDELRIEGIKDLAKPIRESLRSRYMGGYKPSFVN